MGGPSAAIGHIGRCAGPTDPTDHAAALGSAARAAGRRRGLRSDLFPIVVWFSLTVNSHSSVAVEQATNPLRPRRALHWSIEARLRRVEEVGLIASHLE